jgi:cytochrome c biogenesis protein CcmG, thiol:disulfide interchange protein DsbE
MRRMVKDWLMALSIGALVFFAIQWLQPKPEIPDQAPDFQVTTFGGDTVSLSALRGKTVVLNFWATWCGPCKSEAPAFSRFAQAHPEIPVIGLSVDSGSPSAVRATAKQWDIRYPVAMAGAQLQQRYDISTLPTTIIVDPEGQVKTIHVGTMSERQLARAIR